MATDFTSKAYKNFIILPDIPVVDTEADCCASRVAKLVTLLEPPNTNFIGAGEAEEVFNSKYKHYSLKIMDNILLN